MNSSEKKIELESIRRAAKQLQGRAAEVLVRFGRDESVSDPGLVAFVVKAANCLEVAAAAAEQAIERMVETAAPALRPSEFDPETCPGCGCLPGDGLTEGCSDPDGCGYFHDE